MALCHITAYQFSAVWTECEGADWESVAFQVVEQLLGHEVEHCNHPIDCSSGQILAYNSVQLKLSFLLCLCYNVVKDNSAQHEGCRSYYRLYWRPG